MKPTEVMLTLATIDNEPGLTIEEIADKTSLGYSAVRLITDELARLVVNEDYEGRLTVSRIGDEVMMVRGASAMVAETPSPEA